MITNGNHGATRSIAFGNMSWMSRGYEISCESRSNNNDDRMFDLISTIYTTLIQGGFSSCVVVLAKQDSISDARARVTPATAKFDIVFNPDKMQEDFICRDKNSNEYIYGLFVFPWRDAALFIKNNSIYNALIINYEEEYVNEMKNCFRTDVYDVIKRSGPIFVVEPIFDDERPSLFVAEAVI